MSQKFLEYIKEEFKFENDEFENFKNTFSKPLKKTIRINTNLISVNSFLELCKKYNWELEKSDFWHNMYYVRSIWDEKSIWNSFFHLVGLFYIQELAASSSVYYLSWDQIDTGKYTILDMASSPWWKTTQIAEYYPNATIIANEIDKQRLPQLFTNIEKSRSKNIVITNYDARFFDNYKEIFDKIILDAPCSWEWTCYKSLDAVKYWNIKNIKNIAKLQLQLIKRAWYSLKVWWEMVFSTCTLNTIENEWVLKNFLDEYWEFFEIIPLSKNNSKKNDTLRFWPHLDNTWWFFVVKLQKISSFELKKEQKWVNMPSTRFDKLTSKEERNLENFFQVKIWIQTAWYYFFKVGNYVYASKNNLSNLSMQNIYIIKWWVNIWEFDGWVFVPNSYISIFEGNNILSLNREQMIDYISWKNLNLDLQSNYEYILLSFENIVFSIWKITNSNIINMFPKKFIINN